MPQNEYIEDYIKKHGYRLNYTEKKRKKEARTKNMIKKLAQSLKGIKAKIFAQKQKVKKIEERRKVRVQSVDFDTKVYETNMAIPGFLMDRDNITNFPNLNSKIKEQRKEMCSKYQVPVPRVQGISEMETFKSITTGKKKGKHWKRMVLKPTFVGEYTRKPPMYERFIRPMALRYTHANVSHPDLKTTFQLPIISVKNNPHSTIHTALGILTKGTIIEVNVSELGMVSSNGRIVWGKYAQITNKPENDGCINAVLLS
ncbi:Ribosome biogenesis protein NSA2 [Dictyocoela muelleri]|nr:Ribosome biogenesis protein NSA2 [Dictyocoela muelleri]